MTYAGLTSAVSKQEEYIHLGGNIIEGDPFTFCPLVWRYLIDRFAVRSVLDLGSGLGFAARWFFNQGVATCAVDGLRENVRNAVYPTVLCDLTTDSVHTSVDLVHCQEVVEHIEEKYIDNLMKSLMCGRFAVITHALPDQGGYHHVNEKPIEYWVHQFTSRGYGVLIEDSNRIRRIAAQEGARYMAASGLVFAAPSTR
ncbi:MAG: methyltransferase domain-containing protein [Rhodospirillaceae bacterium]